MQGAPVHRPLFMKIQYYILYIEVCAIPTYRVYRLWLQYISQRNYWGFSTNDVHVVHKVYTWKVSLDENFNNPSEVCNADRVGGNNFHRCGKGRHPLCNLNTRHKISMTNFLPMRVVSDNFSLFLQNYTINFSLTVYAGSKQWNMDCTWKFWCSTFRCGWVYYFSIIH